jgi:hypothetical protein
MVEGMKHMNKAGGRGTMYGRKGRRGGRSESAPSGGRMIVETARCLHSATATATTTAAAQEVADAGEDGDEDLQEKTGNLEVSGFATSRQRERSTEVIPPTIEFNRAPIAEITAMIPRPIAGVGEGR